MCSSRLKIINQFRGESSITYTQAWITPQQVIPPAHITFANLCLTWVLICMFVPGGGTPATGKRSTSNQNKLRTRCWTVSPTSTTQLRKHLGPMPWKITLSVLPIPCFVQQWNYALIPFMQPPIIRLASLQPWWLVPSTSRSSMKCVGCGR